MARIRDLMQKHIVAVSRNTSVGAAMELMKRARVSVLPVLEGTTLAGVLTMSEAERQGDRWGEGKMVSDLNLRLLYVELSDKPDKAAKLMVTNKVNRLPVVNTSKDMKCVGVISSTEVARHHKKKIL